jgi:hypothetical protein
MAVIIFLAGRRHGRWPLALPAALDVALDHIIWLRITHPAMSPQAAVEAIGATAHTWAEVVRAFAAAWEALPEHVRREGKP